MTYSEFYTGLCILRAIDWRDLPAELNNEPYVMDAREWKSFVKNPFRWFLEAPEGKVELVFHIIERRIEAPKSGGSR